MKQTSEEHVDFHKDKLSEQSQWLLKKDASLRGRRERVFVLEQELVSTSADIQRLTAQSTADLDLIDGFCTNVAIHETAAQEPASAHTQDREELLADKAVVETEFHDFQADMHAKMDWSQVSVYGKLTRGNALHSECVRLLFSENSLKRYLQFRSEDS